MVELLWSTGFRVSELSRLVWEDVNLDEKYVVVRQSETGKPRLAPLSARVCQMMRRTPRCADSLLGMSTQAFQRRLNRIGAPTAHAFRHGWAVHALENGSLKRQYRLRRVGKAGRWLTATFLSCQTPWR